MKKKEIYFGKGLKRIYFTIAGLWLCIPFGAILTGNKAGLTMADLVPMIALPFVIYFILIFIIKGFRK